jgi:biotin carboxyl carrier protein
VTAPGRSGGLSSRHAVRVDGTIFTVEIEDQRADGVFVVVDGQPVAVDARLPRTGTGSLLLDGVSYVVDLAEGRGSTHVVVDGETFQVHLEDPGRGRPVSAGKASDGDGQRLVAPMPGKVVAVLVAVGQRVDAGAGLVVLEAMKMENEFKATANGVITEVHVAPGQAVDAGDLLVVVA